MNWAYIVAGVFAILALLAWGMVLLFHLILIDAEQERITVSDTRVLREFTR